MHREIRAGEITRFLFLAYPAGKERLLFKAWPEEGRE
jgi:hypothetical protein